MLRAASSSTYEGKRQPHTTKRGCASYRLRSDDPCSRSEQGGANRCSSGYRLPKEQPESVRMSSTHDDECFLCNPDPKLIVGSRKHTFCMVGLGPVTTRYLLIATKMHVRSFADMYLENHTMVVEVEALRLHLQGQSASLTMTEHGRVPACVSVGDKHDAHCFHAHFLLFECKEDIEDLASSYFLTKNEFTNLSDALEFAAENENYHLLSPNPTKYLIYTEPLNVPRQFFRTLVAITEGQSETADWRDFPNRDLALSFAAREREIFGVSHADW
jgi:hypothetical protein